MGRRFMVGAGCSGCWEYALLWVGYGGLLAQLLC